jgi:hypothetical protein
MITKLRTLTEKSLLKYGSKYSDCKVGDLLNSGGLVNREREYLIWSYYNLSNISFSESVLSSLGITNKIDKPGKNEDAFIEWKKSYISGLTDNERMGYYSHSHAIQRSKVVSVNYKVKALNSKHRRQRVNHGHQSF